MSNENDRNETISSVSKDWLILEILVNQTDVRWIVRQSQSRDGIMYVKLNNIWVHSYFIYNKSLDNWLKSPKFD